MRGVGIEPNRLVPRFTFGSSDLLAGIDFIPAVIGLFAVSIPASAPY